MVAVDLEVGSVVDIDFETGIDLEAGPKVDVDIEIDSDLEMGIDLEGSTHEIDSRNLGHVLDHCCSTTDYVVVHTFGIHYPKILVAGLGSSDQSSTVCSLSLSLGKGHSPGLHHYSACSRSSGPVTEMGCVRSPDVALRNLHWARTLVIRSVLVPSRFLLRVACRGHASLAMARAVRRPAYRRTATHVDASSGQSAVCLWWSVRTHVSSYLM